MSANPSVVPTIPATVTAAPEQNSTGTSIPSGDAPAGGAFAGPLVPEFPVPGVFTYGHPRCFGDLIVESADRVRFCISKALITMSGGHFHDQQATEDPSLVPYLLPFPRIRLREEAEIVLALLQALHPLPAVPIASLDKGLKCLVAAEKYGLRPSIFRVDYNVLNMNDPFGVCALAWSTGDWLTVQRAYRFMHDFPESQLMLRALRLPKGGEVFGAVMATRARRQRAILFVVGMLPRELICQECRTSRHNTWAPLIQSVAGLFETPFPDVNRLFSHEESMWGPHTSACLSNACLLAVTSFVYTDQQRQEISQALDDVPQTIEDWFINQKASHVRRDLEMGWIH